MASPYIELRDVPLPLFWPQRTRLFSRMFDGGRVHAVVGQSDAAWTVVRAIAGRVVPASGAVLVCGQPPDATSIPMHLPAKPASTSFFSRFLSRTRPSAEVVVERALAGGPVVIVCEPFAEASPDGCERVVAAVRAAAARGVTVVVQASALADASLLADVLHLFDDDGEPGAWGDVAEVYSPDVGDPLSPDALVNHMGPASVVAFDGVLIPLRPRGSELAVDSFGGGGGFIAWQWETWFHVPARRVVWNPTFRHEEPSGSEPLVVHAPLAPRAGVVGMERQGVEAIDPTARWVVLDARVEEVRVIGGRVRATVATPTGAKFHVDVPEGAVRVGEEVRIGFDSACVVS